MYYWKVLYQCIGQAFYVVLDFEFEIIRLGVSLFI